MKQLLSKQNKLKCQICGRKVSTYTSKICIKCLAITSKGKNNHNYKQTNVLYYMDPIKEAFSKIKED